MKNLSLTALLLSAGLFVMMGTTSLSAGDMKCGAGKCGASMKSKDAKCGGKCDGDKKANAKCGGEKKTCSECDNNKKSSKCGDDKKAPKKAAKCGQGKCG